MRNFFHVDLKIMQNNLSDQFKSVLKERFEEPEGEVGPFLLKDKKLDTTQY